MSLVIHEAYSFDSQELELFWWDDFLGDQIADEWRQGGGAIIGVVDQQTGGICRLDSPAGGVRYIDWNNIRTLHVDKRVALETRVKLSRTTNFQVRFALHFDPNNVIRFGYDTGVPHITWHIQCEDGGVPTDNDSGVTPDTSYHRFRIQSELDGGSHVHFYIDGVQTANSPITTNIPDDATDFLQPNIRVDALDATTPYIDIDYVGVRQLI